MRIQDIDERLEAAFDALSTLQAEQRALPPRRPKPRWRTKRRSPVRCPGTGSGAGRRSGQSHGFDACEDSHLAMVLAESDLRVNRSTITTLTTQVDILRTMAASHRSVF